VTSDSAKATPALRYGRALASAVLAALVVRLIVVAFVYQGFLDPGRDHWEFGFEVGMVARSIATGHGFGNPYWEETGPTALLTPVFPYFLAGIFIIFGIKTKAAAIAMLALNSLFSALTCVPIFFVAKKTFGIRAAKWAAWIWAFFPYAIFFSADSMWYHCFFALLLTLLVLFVLHLENATSLWVWAAFGVLAGLTALTTPVVLGVLPFMIGWVCYRLRQRARSWRAPLGTAVLVLIATIAPWLVRNYQTFHKPVFLKDNFWMEVCIGNAGNGLHWWNGSVIPPGRAAELEEIRRVGELAYLEEKRKLALDFIEAHPGIYLWRCLRRVVFIWTGFWSFQREYLREEPFDPANIFFCTLFTVFALAGLRKAFREKRDMAVLYALILGTFPIIFYVTHPDLAYRHPIDPEIVILGAYAIVSRQSLSKGEPERALGGSLTRGGTDPK
jgi:4-amino-4-deoxy-L-arabinose transferase-like glycosyltransferase